MLRIQDGKRAAGKRLTPPSDEEWRRQVAIVARYMPGLGDPMGMTLADMQAWSDALVYVLERENGRKSDADDHRARVEADMRRLHG